MDIRKILTLKRFFKIITSFFLFFFIYISINNVYLRWKSYNQIEDYLVETVDRITYDLNLLKNKWDTSAYLSDGEIPTDNPLYIFTIEGFLIDRANSINGFLDTADLNYVNSFNKFSTLTSPINEMWRVYSLPILSSDGDLQGSILVSVLYPKLSALNEIDKDLQTSANKIKSSLSIENGQLMLKGDFPVVDYTISYIVVDKYNKIIVEQGGPPAYIDRSYVSKFLKNTDFQKVKDEISGEEYLITQKIILRQDKTPIGVVISGKSLKTVNDVLKNQFIFSILSGFIFFTLLIITGLYLFSPLLSQIIYERANEIYKFMVEQNKTKFLNPKKIIFDIDSSLIFFDENKFKIIPDTNHYYFCKKLFSKPKNKWENDELLDNFVGDRDKPRAVYDCYFSLNKKIKKIIGKNLFTNEGRRFSFNSDLIGKIKKLS